MPKHTTEPAVDNYIDASFTGFYAYAVALTAGTDKVLDSSDLSEFDYIRTYVFDATVAAETITIAKIEAGAMYQTMHIIKTEASGSLTLLNKSAAGVGSEIWTTSDADDTIPNGKTGGWVLTYDSNVNAWVSLYKPVVT
jgi:hypothetical protein